MLTLWTEKMVQHRTASESSMVGREKAARALLLCYRQPLPISHLYGLLLKEKFTRLTFAHCTAGAKCLVIQVCCCLLPNCHHPVSRHNFFPPHTQGESAGWLEEQREPKVTTSHSHNPPKAAEIPPTLQTSSPLALPTLQQSKLSVADPLSPLGSPSSHHPAPSSSPALLSPQSPRGAPPAALLRAHHCQPELCPPCQNTFSLL